LYGCRFLLIHFKLQLLVCFRFQWAVTTSVDFSLAQLIQVIILLSTGGKNGGGYEASKYVVIALHGGILLVHGIINSLPISLLSFLGQMAAIWNVLGMKKIPVWLAFSAFSFHWQPFLNLLLELQTFRCFCTYDCDSIRCNGKSKCQVCFHSFQHWKWGGNQQQTLHISFGTSDESVYLDWVWCISSYGELFLLFVFLLGKNHALH